MIGLGALVTMAATAAVKTVPAHWVLATMVRLQPYQDHTVRLTYDETSEAIAQAASEDPIFEGDDGAMKTAALLLSMAWHESRFNPRAIGDHGKSFGLFQIQPGTSKTTANQLLLPRDASRIAIKLIKTSLAVCHHVGWNERLSWYCAGGAGCRKAGALASARRMFLAQKIAKEERGAFLLEAAIATPSEDE